MASRQREFNLQVRFTTANASHYETVQEAMSEYARTLNALFLMLAGQGIPPPKIVLTSEDFIEGTHEIAWQENPDEAAARMAQEGQ